MRAPTQLHALPPPASAPASGPAPGGAATPPPAPAPRLGARLRRYGPRGCSDADLLALLVDPTDRSGRASTVAQAVITAAGGLAGLRTVSADELQAAHGLSSARSLAVVAAFELGRRGAAAWPSGRWRVHTPADVADRLMPEMGHLEREELRVVVLNTKNVVLAAETLYVGNLAGSAVRVGEVFREAVRRCGGGVIVVHNHPSGDPTPSTDDLRITREIAEAGRLLDIDLLDHVVIGHGRWVSLRALGALG